MAIFQSREDDLIRIATYQHPCDAHSIRILLESHGIQATVSGEESNAVFGAVGLGDAGLVGVEVLVKRADVAQAELIIDEVPAASEAIIPPWTCDCGEDVDEGFSVCWSCGKSYPEEAEQN